MRKLNIWHRLGIVASVLWFVGGGIWQRTSDVARASDMMGFTYRTCTESAALKNIYNFTPCMDEATKQFELFLEGSWGNVAFMAIVPIALGWLGAYFILWVTRWVLAGRENSN